MTRRNYKMDSRGFLYLFFPFCVLLLSSCALVGGSEKLKRSKDYTVQAPEGWRATANVESDRAFRLQSGSIATLTSSCDHRSNAPLNVLSKQLFLGARKKKVFKDEKETIGTHAGQWTEAQVEMEGVPIRLQIFVVSNSGCVFDFSLMKNGGLGKDDTEQFREFITSLEYGKD